MLVLGIESSCDETAVALVEDGRRVLSNVVATQVDTHALYGGVVPEIASRLHAERIMPVFHQSLQQAGVTLGQVDRIAVANRPGLVGALLVGIAGAKALAWSTGKRLVSVNHVHAHLVAPFLDTDISLDRSLPALGLVASGGHTSLFRVDAGWRLDLLGATIDDAIGEAYDKAASILELGYPGGPVIDKLANQACDAEKADAPDFPVSRLERSSLDFSFSGLKTAVLYAVRGVPRRVQGQDKPVYERTAADLTDAQVRGICSAFQRAAISAIELKLNRALDWMAEAGKPAESMLVGGGVAANSALRQAVGRLSKERDIPSLIPPLSLCVDNAAMIAAMGYYKSPLSESEFLHLDAHARAVS